MRPGQYPGDNPQQPNTRPTNGADRPGTFQTEAGGPGDQEPTRSTAAANPTPHPSPGGNTTNPTSPTAAGNNNGPGGSQGSSDVPSPGASSPGASSPGGGSPGGAAPGAGGSPIDIGNQVPGGTGGGPVSAPGQ